MLLREKQYLLYHIQYKFKSETLPFFYGQELMKLVLHPQT